MNFVVLGASYFCWPSFTAYIPQWNWLLSVIYIRQKRFWHCSPSDVGRSEFYSSSSLSTSNSNCFDFSWYEPDWDFFYKNSLFKLPIYFWEFVFSSTFGLKTVLCCWPNRGAHVTCAVIRRIWICVCLTDGQLFPGGVDAGQQPRFIALFLLMSSFDKTLLSLLAFECAFCRLD